MCNFGQIWQQNCCSYFSCLKIVIKIEITKLCLLRCVYGPRLALSRKPITLSLCNLSAQGLEKYCHEFVKYGQWKACVSYYVYF